MADLQKDGLDLIVVGSTIRATTCLGDTFQGKVIAYNNRASYAVLRCPIDKAAGAGATARTAKIVFLNTHKITTFVELDDAEEQPDKFALPVKQLQREIDAATDRRQRDTLHAIRANIPSQGVIAFRVLSEEFGGDNVFWRDDELLLVVKAGGGGAEQFVLRKPYDAKSLVSANQSPISEEMVKRVDKAFDTDADWW